MAGEAPTALPNRPERPVIVAVSGASGASLARRAVERLMELGRPIELIGTPSARIVWKQELGISWSDEVRGWVERGSVVDHGPNNQAATIASGSYPAAGMLVIPCSMGTVASIAAGLANTLLLRAADVMQKEGRRLVLVPRETPLSIVHLQNLLTLAQRGIRIVPPMPNFYQRPTTVAEVVDFVAARALVALGVLEALDLEQQWQGLD